MHTPSTFSRFKRTDRPALLVICLAFSLLLHLSIAILLPLLPPSATQRFLDQKPTFVRLVDKPAPLPKETKKTEYELDQHPPQQNQLQPEKAERLAERPQRVEKEQAPKGIDTKDQRAISANPVSTNSSETVAARKPPGNANEKSSNNNQVERSYDTPSEKEPELNLDRSRASAKSKQQSSKEFPPLEQLLRLPQSTMDRLAKEGRATSEKIKQRDDIQEGDEVWLNLEQGLLISFFRRFRNQIEGVWNYPIKAAENGVEGVLLLKITIDREGQLLDVDLLNGSGSDLLDYEAIQAVYRAAPFGPLPKQYPHPELKINAYFKYMLGGKYIYGR